MFVMIFFLFGKNKNITVKLDLFVSHSLKEKLSARGLFRVQGRCFCDLLSGLSCHGIIAAASYRFSQYS